MTESRKRAVLFVALALAVSLAAVPASAKPPADGHMTVADIEFIGATEFETGYMFEGTEVGGLSGIVYDKWKGVYHALADDKSEINDARFYTLTIDLSDGELDDGDVVFTDVTFLRDKNGMRFAPESLDPEGFEIVGPGRLLIGSEPEIDDGTLIRDQWIKRFNPTGKENRSLQLPDYFAPDPDESGTRDNLGFESLTVTPDAGYLFAATENALEQDGPISSVTEGSPSRVIQFRVAGLKPMAEYVYEVEPIPFKEGDRFADHGLVEMQAIDNSGTFLTMERSFASGIGNTILIFEASIEGASDVSGLDDLTGTSFIPMSKKLVLAVTEPGNPQPGFEYYDLDNMEGMAFGPMMEDGRIPLIIVADNNFNAPFQRTLFMAYLLDLDKVH